MTAAPELRSSAGPLAPSTAVDIVGCGVLSAAGARPESLLGPRAPKGVLPGEGWPPITVAPVAGFRPEEVLGRKGLSRLSRTDQLAMAASLAALDEAGEGPSQAGTGIVLGTSIGSAGTLLEFFRDTFEQERPYLVNPAQFPSTLMNSAGGKTAIRQALTGVNATVSGGPMAGMHAVRYALGMLRQGHARRLLTGAVEELTPETAWAWHAAGRLARGTSLGEGCAVFALDAAASASARRYGRILACETGFVDAAKGGFAVARRLVDAVRNALGQAGVSPHEITLAVPGASGRRGWAGVEERALREAVPASGRFDTTSLLGETHGASVALQLAGLLARWTYRPAAERSAVVTSLGFDGSVGCLVVGPPDAEEDGP